MKPIDSTKGAMALRASWTGHLKISLVTIPVRLYNAVSSTSRVSFHQLHKDCGERIRYELTCPIHGHVERDEVVKGYEYEKNRHVVMDEEDLEKVWLETSKVIELAHFSPVADIPPTYFDAAYYLAPDGRIAADAFATFREAMQRSGRAGIGRVVLAGKEKIIALRAYDRGLLMNTLNYPHEVRKPTAYFEDVPVQVSEGDQLALGDMLIERMSKPFEPEAFTDRFQEQVLEIVRAKVAGREPALMEQRPTADIVDLMEALKRSLDQEGGAPAAAPKKTAAKKPPAPSRAAGRERKKKSG